MNDGKHCPACGKDIGLVSVLRAPLPTRVRCPHCAARLGYRGGGALILGFFLLLLVVAVGAFYVVRQIYPPSHPRFYVALVVVALALMLPIELAAALYLRRRGRLQSPR